MKTYIWIGPKRLVPRHGILDEGDEIALDKTEAGSLLKQGLVKDLLKKIRTKKVKE